MRFVTSSPFFFLGFCPAFFFAGMTPTLSMDSVPDRRLGGVIDSVGRDPVAMAG